MYTQDSDGRFPDGIRSAHKGVGWSNFLLPYVKAHNVFRCNLDGFAEAEHGTRSQQPISYGYNSNLAGCSAKDANFAAATVTIFETTGSSADLSSHQYPLAAGDELAPSGNGLDGQLFCTVLNSCAAKYATGLFGRASLQQTQFAVSGPRHNGGSNFVFADGHVKCIKAGMLSAGANAKSQFDVQTGGVTGHAAGTGKGSRGTFSLI
jgi:prepilin-type processing-associated H-X9-DG protein